MGINFVLTILILVIKDYSLGVALGYLRVQKNFLWGVPFLTVVTSPDGRGR